ncbi:MAG: hypothetical protein LUD00_01520 [Prevotellaceae bacterium]|nr:hypothetical protein [Prevotellaceae bacterium]
MVTMEWGGVIKGISESSVGYFVPDLSVVPENSKFAYENESYNESDITF